VKLSIVIPVFNEAATLREIVRRVIQVEVGGDKELILVDDGSTDGTRDLYPEIQKEYGDRVRVILHERNRGKGAALRTGFEHSGCRPGIRPAPLP